MPPSLATAPGAETRLRRRRAISWAAQPRGWRLSIRRGTPSSCSASRRRVSRQLAWHAHSAAASPPPGALQFCFAPDSLAWGCLKLVVWSFSVRDRADRITLRALQTIPGQSVSAARRRGAARRSSDSLVVERSCGPAGNGRRRAVAAAASWLGLRSRAAQAGAGVDRHFACPGEVPGVGRWVRARPRAASRHRKPIVAPECAVAERWPTWTRSLACLRRRHARAAGTARAARGSRSSRRISRLRAGACAALSSYVTGMWRRARETSASSAPQSPTRSLSSPRLSIHT